MITIFKVLLAILLVALGAAVILGAVVVIKVVIAAALAKHETKSNTDTK